MMQTFHPSSKPAVIGRETEYTLDRSSVQHRADAEKQRCGNLCFLGAFNDTLRMADEAAYCVDMTTACINMDPQ